nr:zinc-ribbon domain-containing protein [Roseovarius sp. MMSF_3350]
MRLICPNCGAQYEVPTEVIPTSGRDVQCSDCGTTWFQNHPDHPAEEPEAAQTDTPVQDGGTAEETPSWPEPDADYGAEEDEDDAPRAEDPAQDDADMAFEDDAPEDEHFPEERIAPASDPKRREIDPAVADVLREEAEREARAREQDHRGTVETQQELGLQEADNDARRRSAEARARMARLRGEPEARKTDAEIEEIDPASRSNLLPDIDEINSSLDSDGRKEEPRPISAADDNTDASVKSGFRSGFRLAVVLAVLALVIYVFAPQLSDAVPQLAGPLTGYVEMVNGWRAGLNDLIQSMAASLSEDTAADG